MDEKQAIKETLTCGYIKDIVEENQKNPLVKRSGWQKVDFNSGIESPDKLKQVVKQLIYEMAVAKAEQWIREHIDIPKKTET